MSAVRKARADALLDLLQRAGRPYNVDDLSWVIQGWTRAAVERAVDDLAEAGRVRLTTDYGQVSVSAGGVDA